MNKNEIIWEMLNKFRVSDEIKLKTFLKNGKFKYKHVLILAREYEEKDLENYVKELFKKHKKYSFGYGTRTCTYAPQLQDQYIYIY